MFSWNEPAISQYGAAEAGGGGAATGSAATGGAGIAGLAGGGVLALPIYIPIRTPSARSRRGTIAYRLTALRDLLVELRRGAVINGGGWGMTAAA
jgi:hypothetical protein